MARSVRRGQLDGGAARMTMLEAAGWFAGMFLTGLSLAAWVEWRSHTSSTNDADWHDPDGDHKGIDWEFWAEFKRTRMTQGADGVWRLKKSRARRKAG